MPQDLILDNWHRKRKEKEEEEETMNLSETRHKVSSNNVPLDAGMPTVWR
jgi:hypothetical protein